MSFNPKAKKLADIEQKEVNKKAIDKLGLKFNPTTGKKAPFFIKTDHKYPDGKEAPLFIFGKIKQYKATTKDLKGNTELHGLAYVEYDDKQVSTLCLAPTKGKLDTKETALKKAMKDAFTAAYAQYKLLPPLTEEEAAAAEAAMEAMSDEDAPEQTAATEQATSSNLPEILTVSIAEELSTTIAFYKEMKNGTEEELALLFGEHENFLEAVDRLKLICELARSFQTAPEGETKLKIRQDAANAFAGHIDSYIKMCDFIPSKTLHKQAACLRKLRVKIEKFATPIAAVDLKITEKQLKGETFGERGIAGEQSASDVAKAKRDAEVSEVALELAKLLDLGRSKDSNELFADAIRWVAVASANLGAAEANYQAATEKLYQTKSTLGADLRSVFGDGLRGLFIQQLLVDKVSKYASLATALGCLGKTAFARMFSGEKQDAVAIYSKYDNPTLAGLMGSDPFAQAAYKALSVEQRAQTYNLWTANKTREQLAQTPQDSPEFKTLQQETIQKSDTYLTQMVDKLTDENETLGIGSLKEETLFEELEAWAENATDAEKAALSNPNSAFYKKLLSEKNQRVVDLALLTINKPKDTSGKGNDKTMFEFEKLVVERKHAGWFTGMSKTEAGAEVQKLLFAKQDGIKDPQEAIIAKFYPEKLEDFRKDTLTADEKAAILQKAVTNMKAKLKEMGVADDIQEGVEESILSNGARGSAYQQISEYAAKDVNSLADKTITVLKALDPTSPEWATIKNDEKLLKTLKFNIADSAGRALKNHEQEWLPIARLLGLKGEWLEFTYEANKDTEKLLANSYEGLRKQSRLKVTTNAEKEQLEAQQKTMRKEPSYWAQTLFYKYDKGVFTTDEFEVMNTVMQAQKESNWAEVLTQLSAISPDAWKFVTTYMDKMGITAEVSPATMFQIIEKEDTVFTFNSSNQAKFKKILLAMEPNELIEYCFNIKDLTEPAKTAVQQKEEALKAQQQAVTKEEKDKAEEAIEQANTNASKATLHIIQNLDISKEFTKTLNKVFPINLAFDLKVIIRDKVVAELAKTENADSVQALLPTFSKEEVKLLVEYIRALSSNEKEDMSRTGVQYYDITTKGQQRDVAAAVHSRELAKVQNVLNSKLYHTMKPAEREVLLQSLNKGLKIAAEEKEKTFQSFEERKKTYDNRIKSAINFVVSAALKFATIPLKAIPFLGKTIETAVVAITETVVGKILGGDRVGSWKNAIAKGGKDFLIKLAKGILSEAAPMIIESALGESGFSALESAGNKIADTRDKIIASNKFLENSVKAIKSTAKALDESKIGQFIKDTQTTIAELKKTIEDNHGLLGKVVIEVVEEQVEAVKGKIEEKMEGFKQKMIGNLTANRKWLDKGLTVLGTAKATYDKMMEAYEAINNINVKRRLEEFQNENPDLAGGELIAKLKELKDFEEFEDADWVGIEEYTDLSDKLQEDFEDFFSGEVEGVLESEEAEEAVEASAEEGGEGAERTLDGAKPKESLIKLRDMMKASGQAVPEEIELLISKL